MKSLPTAGRDDADRLRKDDPAHDHPLGQTKRARRLDLAAGNGLDAGSEDLGQVGAVVESEGDDPGRQRRDDDPGRRQGQEDEQDLDDERRPADDRDVEGGCAVEERVRRKPPESAEDREEDREEDRRRPR